MDKKIGVSILFGFFLLVGLYGVTDVVKGSISAANTDVVSYGEILDNSSSIQGGVEEILNVTVAVGTTDGSVNYSNISIRTVSGTDNITFSGSFYALTDVEDEVSNGVNITLSNITVYSGTQNIANWECINKSASQVICMNLTAGSGLGGNGSSLDIRFNVTSFNNFESVEQLNVTIWDTEETPTSVLKPLVVDGAAPRVIDLNVSDGNVTWLNSSDETAIYLELDQDATITVNVNVQEAHPDPNAAYIILSNANFSNVTRDDFAFSTMTTAIAPAVDADGVYTFTFTPAGNESNMMFVFNDSYNQETEYNGSGIATGAVSLTGDPVAFWMNDTLVEVRKINITHSNNGFSHTITNPVDNTSWIAPINTTIDVEVAGEYKGELVSYFRESGPVDIFRSTPLDVQGHDYADVLFDGVGVDFNITATDVGAAVALYSYSIDFTGNSTTNNPSIGLIINASQGYQGGSRAAGVNTPNLKNYTSSAVYTFRLDGETPQPTITTDKSSVTVNDATGVEATCTSSEGDSGVRQYRWTLKKPGSDVEFTDETTAGSKKRTFESGNINEAGVYTLECEVADTVGNVASKSVDFSVTYDTSTSASSSSGTTTGGTPTVSFDVDFSTETTGSIKAQQGRIKSFSFDGATKHTMAFDQVTATSATITISSDPVTISLSVGETKEVDINADGISDMTVMLKSVVNGLADVVIGKIEAGAQVVAREDREAAGIPEPGEPSEPTERAPTPVEGSSTGLWVTLLIIVAVIVVGYFVYRKK